MKNLKSGYLQGGDGASLIKGRLQKAALEIKQEQDEQLYKYHIVNDNFDTALEQLTLMIKKELFGQSCKL